MARRSGRAKMAWVRSFRKSHRRRRRNPFPVAGMVVNRRRRRRRNPGFMARYRRRRSSGGRGTTIMGLSLPPLTSVLYVGAGFAGVPVAEGFINGFLPLSMTTSVIGKYAVRVGTVIGLSMLAKMILGKQEATMVGIGGGAYTLISAIREFAPGVIPGLSGYTMPSLGAYAPARRARLGAPAFGALNTPAFAAGGANNVVAARFRRFQ